MIEKDSSKANIILEKIRTKEAIKNKITDKHLLRRFEDLVDVSSD